MSSSPSASESEVRPTIISLCGTGECPPVVELLADGRIAVNGTPHTQEEFGQFLEAARQGTYDWIVGAAAK